MFPFVINRLGRHDKPSRIPPARITMALHRFHRSPDLTPLDPTDKLVHSSARHSAVVRSVGLG